MNLKKKLVSLLLSASVIANITSVSLFALNFNMSFSDFSCEIFKLGQSMEKIVCNSSGISMDEKLRFLESEGFEQIENILVNAPRFPGGIWKDFLRCIENEMFSITITNLVKNGDKKIRSHLMPGIMYYMIRNYLDYIDNFHNSLPYWNICSETYELLLENAKNQKNYFKYKRFKKMSLFCKGCALISTGNIFLEDRSFYDAIVSFRSAYKCFEEVDVVWGMESARKGIAISSYSLEKSYDTIQEAPLSCPVISEKQVMSEKNTVDKPFLLSLWFDAYNSAIKKFLYEPQKGKNPLNFELAPLRLEESSSEESELYFEPQKRKSFSRVKLAPLRLKDCSEPPAKKAKLDDQTKSSDYYDSTTSKE